MRYHGIAAWLCRHRRLVAAVPPPPRAHELIGWAGVALAGVGLLIEAVADEQKLEAKRAAPAEPVMGGLYSWCRHPNYLGEILFHLGVCGLAAVSQQRSHRPTDPSCSRRSTDNAPPRSTDNAPPRHSAVLLQSHGTAAQVGCAVLSPLFMVSVMWGAAARLDREGLERYGQRADYREWYEGGRSLVPEPEISRRALAKAYARIERRRGKGAAAVACCLAAVLTEICLRGVCSCQEILRRNGRGQATRGGGATKASARERGDG
jgi:protein-S-isoprenylcysteine O-methyltransferase Ste14